LKTSNFVVKIKLKIKMANSIIIVPSIFIVTGIVAGGIIIAGFLLSPTILSKIMYFLICLKKRDFT
jgi:hypothetical protein